MTTTRRTRVLPLLAIAGLLLTTLPTAVSAGSASTEGDSSAPVDSAVPATTEGADELPPDDEPPVDVPVDVPVDGSPSVDGPPTGDTPGSEPPAGDPARAESAPGVGRPLGMLSPRNGAAAIGITKTVSRPAVQPGEELEYRLVASCSSLTVDCVDFVLTDVLPLELEVTSLPSSNSQRQVTFDPITRLLTVAYTLSLGDGQIGLPAGSSQSVAVGMRLPSQTALLDDALIANTAEVTAANAPSADDTVTVTADIPVRITPVASKTWAPSTAIAQSGAPSTITLGARNGSTTSTEITDLRISDTTAATWDRFDLVSAGTVTRFPDGADEVRVEACTVALPTGCTDAQYVVGDPQAGPTLTLPVGVNAGDVTGIRYVFSSSTDALLPFDSSLATVETPVVLRSAYRTSGDPISPTTSEKISNCATSTLTGPSGTSTSTPVCAPFAIQPDSVTVTTAKTMFADQNATFSSSGAVVAGQDSGVTMRITAKNDSSFPVPIVRITEPSPTATTDFGKIAVRKARLTFPTGATTADLTVDCRTGTDPAVVTVARPTSGVVTIDSLGCDSGVGAASVIVEYRGVTIADEPTITSGSTATLELHGAATGAVIADVTDGGLTNCAVAIMSSRVDGTGSASSEACTAVGVQAPRPGVGSGTKTTNGVTSIVPDQNLVFGLSFRNTGNIPVSNVVLVDPPDPTASPNPFSVVSLVSLRSVTSAPDSRLEVYDPTVSAYVPYNASNTALLTRARGIRVTVTGDMAVGQTFRVEYAVRLRPGATATSFRNCAAVGIGTPDSQFCGPQIVIGVPGTGGNLNKSIEPPEVVRPKPGLPTQYVTVKHRVQNTGTLYLKRLVITDVDADFFDAVVFGGSINVNFPVGANRVQVDVCTSTVACNASTFVTGTRTSSSTPSIPAGVAEADVKGIRFTFTNSNNGYEILPSPNFPTSGRCPGATVCFRAEVRSTLASSPATPVPDRLADTSSAQGESALQAAGSAFDIPAVTATTDIVQGVPRLDVVKAPDSRIGPGDTAPLSLRVTNTGTDVLADPVVRDPFPAGLTLDPVVEGAQEGRPYTIGFTLPAGVAEPTTVVFTELMGDPTDPPVPGCTDVNRVCGLDWSFPGWNLPPSGVIRLSFNVTLSPGVRAGDVIVNTAGATGTNDGLQCDGPSLVDDPSFGDGLFCIDRARITTLAGDDFTAQKWIAGDPALGWRTATGQTVAAGSEQCPRYVVGGVVHTRFPCTARVSPGQAIRYVIRGVNSGTNPASSIVLVDGLPVDGDTGVLLTGQDRATAWSSRPTLLEPVTMVEGRSGVVTSYTTSPFPGSSFCTADLKPGSPCPASAFDDAPDAAVTGFRTVMNFPADDLLEPGESFTLVYRMKAPSTLTSNRIEPLAWNSFAYRPTFRLPGGGTTTLPATEPLKVGVGMPLDSFRLTKRVDGLPSGVVLPPFVFEWSCSIVEADGEVVEIDSRTFTIVDGATYTSPRLPEGAQCRIWETESQGGSSDVRGEENALSFEIGQPDADIIVVNDYEDGSLTIAKTVVWDDVPPVTLPGPFEVTVECAFPSIGDLLPGFPQTIQLVDGASETITGLPVGTACLVEETERQGAMETSIDSSNAAPQDGDTYIALVDAAVDGGTQLTITNTYTTGAIELVKQLVGDASAWAQGPYTFRVTCVDPAELLDDLVEEIVLTPDDLTATISPIPTDYECTTEEVSVGDAASWIIDPVDPVTIPAYTTTPPGPVVVTITNEYPAGSIEVTKTVDGNAAAVMEGAVFGVRVQCERDLADGAGIDVFLDSAIDISDGERILVADDVPLGSRCWATETRTVGATSVTVSHTAAEPVVITDGDSVATIAIVNTYEPGGSRRGLDDEAGVEIVKRLTGPGVDLAEGPFVMEVECVLDGFALPTTTVTLDVDDLVGYVTPLPVGTECSVTEVDDGNAEGAVPRAVGQVVVPVVDADPARVTVTNRFTLPDDDGDGGGGGDGDGDGDGAGGGSGGGLPDTGSTSVATLVPGALAALSLGAVLVFVGRRRRTIA